MHKKFYNFLEVNELMHPLQFGLRKKLSTLHILISMSECIKNTIDSGNCECVLFIDLKKAFDTVYNSIQLKKLELYGVRSIPLQWFLNHIVRLMNGMYLSMAIHLTN